MEELLTRRAPFRTAFSVLGVPLALSACDRLPEAVIFPEFELTYSFDGGLSGWTAAALDMGTGTWTTGEASGAARFELANASGAGKVWLGRELEVTPDTRYAMNISFKLATADHDAAQAWKIIAGARQDPPTLAADLTFQDGTASGAAAGETVWVEKTYSVTVEPDEDGVLHFMLGIWGTTTGTRSYLIDDLKVVLTRTE